MILKRKARYCDSCSDRPEAQAPKRRRAFWTEQQDALLRRWYRKKPTKELASLVGRSISSIHGRAQKLGIATPRGNRYQWTESEIEVVRKRYNSQPRNIDELCELLPHYPRWEIRRCAQRLGIARTKEPVWSSKDEQFLRKWLPHRSLNWIARNLHRTRTAVHLKAKRLGIKKSDAGYTARGAAHGLGVDDHKVTAWISRGLLKASRRETKRRGGQNGDFYYIDPIDLRNFLKTHPDEWSVRVVDKRFLIDVLTTQGGKP